MPKRPADDSPAPPPAPAVRPTARRADTAAWNEAVQPDTWMRALVPNDVIELVGAMLCGPRLLAITSETTQLLDIGAADLHWQFVHGQQADSYLVGVTARGASPSVLEYTIGSDISRWLRVLTLDERTASWACDDPVNYAHDPVGLVSFNHELFTLSNEPAKVCKLTRTCHGNSSEAIPDTTNSHGYQAISVLHRGICVVPRELGRPMLLYDPVGGCWNRLGPMRTPRHAYESASSSDGNTLFSIGGIGPSQSGYTISRASERYDFREGTAHDIAPCPQNARLTALHAMPDDRLLVAYDVDRCNLYDTRANTWIAEPRWDLPSRCFADRLAVF